jgi:hypothetical protein
MSYVCKVKYCFGLSAYVAEGAVVSSLVLCKYFLLFNAPRIPERALLLGRFADFASLSFW